MDSRMARWWEMVGGGGRWREIPIGPFQMIVLDSRMAFAFASIDFGPQSSPMKPSGTPPALSRVRVRVRVMVKVKVIRPPCRRP